MKLRMPRRRLIAITLLVLLAGGAASVWAIHEREEVRHDFLAVAPGVLYRSRQPRPVDLQENLQRLGIRTVVNLRGEFEDPPTFAEEKRLCESLGAKMVFVVTSSPVPTDDELERFLKIVRRNDGATLVHCELGRARAGCMVGAYRVIVEGVRAKKAAEEASRQGEFDSGTRRVVRNWLYQLQGQRQKWLDRTQPER